MVNGLRVLLVDDDEEFLELLAGFLVRCGHAVVACSSVEACLDRAAAVAFDAAVIDGSIRGRDGCEAVETLRSEAREAVIVVLSGRADPERRQRALAAGADRFLLKPCSLFEIHAALCEPSERRRLERRLQEDFTRVGGQ